MARIALAFAGAAIGGIIGGPIGAELGFTLGGMIGGALFPGKPKGPQLYDLQVTSGASGNPIPFGYNTSRVAGQIIWSPGLVQGVVNESAKGGLIGTPTYVYTVDFAACFGEGIASVGRVWGDSKIIYDPTGSQAVITALSQTGNVVTVTSTLNPQIGGQVFISSVGTGGYNGTFQVTLSSPVAFSYFNNNTGLPPLTGTDVGIASFTPPTEVNNGNGGTGYPLPVIYNGGETQGADPTMQAGVGAANCPAYRGLCYAVWTNFPVGNFGNRLPNIRAEVTYSFVPPESSGFGPADGLAQSAISNPPGTNNVTIAAPNNFPNDIAFVGVSRGANTLLSDGTWVNIDTSGNSIWWVKSLQGNVGVAETIGTPNQWWATITQLFQSNGTSLFGTITSVTVLNNVVTCQCVNGFIVGTQVEISGLTNPSNTGLDGGPFTLTAANGTSFSYSFTHANTGPNSDSGTATNLPYLQSVFFTQSAGVFNPVFPNPVRNGSTIVLAVGNTDGNAKSALVGAFPCTDNQGNSYTVYNSGTGANMGGSQSLAVATGVKGGSGFQLNVTIQWFAAQPASWGVMWEFPGGGSSGGPITPATLPDMVTDICLRTGLSSSQFSVNNLPTPSPGYVVSRPSTGQAALQPLMLAYFFDGVESQGSLNFVPRGGATQALTIPESDLGLSKDKYEITEEIDQIQDLPRDYQVLFNDVALDYQQNKAQKRRHTRVVKTRNQNIIELPLVLDSTTALQIAERALYLSYLERKPYAFNLWKSLYMLYDPTDVVQFTYEGLTFVARFTKSTIGADFQTAIECVNENQGVYASSATGYSSGNFVPAGPNFLATTFLALYDIPLLRDSDANPSGSGYYAAVSTLSLSQWPGMSLQKSSDNVDFTQQDVDGAACGYGTALGTLGPPATPWVWDTVNTLRIHMNQGTLAGASDLAVLGGANALMIGNECVQFGNAVQNTDGTYTISRLLRGRRGTEIQCNSHGSLETVVSLLGPGILRETSTSAELQQLRYFRPVTNGDFIANVASQMFTNTGNDLRPYAVTSVAGSRDGSGNVNVTWIRRTRIGGDWLNGIGTVPLSETVESYDVDIIGPTGSVLRTFSALSSPAVTYSAAQQNTDFGSLQSSVNLNIYQNSSAIGRGFKKSVTL